VAASLSRTQTTASRCACCDRALESGLWIEADGQSMCEDCFLRRHPASREAIPAGDPAASLAEALAEALDLREHETGLHSRRVACHTLVLARRVASDPSWLHQVYWGSLLHDIGKIGVPDAILLKRDGLDDGEWREMRAHPEKGHRILSRMPELAQAAELVYSHEERFDGSGYPRGLAGERIPLGARLFALVDTLDAMTSDRPYRLAESFDAARAEIVRMSGTQFDPLGVEVFLAEESTLRQMVELKCTTSRMTLRP